MRLDHLLSKEEGSRGKVGDVFHCSVIKRLKRGNEAGVMTTKKSGGDTAGGNTRSHAEHDG